MTAFAPARSAASALIDDAITPTVPEGSTLRLIAREDAADGVVKLTFADHQGRRLAPWTPGSHIDLILPNGTVRQYSLLGDRFDAFHYEVAVLRELNGRGGSEWIHENAQPGQLFDFGGPRNLFPLVPAQRYLFVAGGIGITPLLPMMAQAEATGIEWKMLFGGRSKESMAFGAELVEKYGDKVLLFPQDECGFPDIPAWLGEPDAHTKVFVCGPPGLIGAVERACEPWPEHTKHSEQFVSKAGGGMENRSFTAELRRTGKTISVGARESLLDALGKVDVSILSSCRQGTCGTCEIRVIAGTPDHRDSVLTDEDRTAGDCLMACVSRSSSEHLVLDI